MAPRLAAATGILLAAAAFMCDHVLAETRCYGVEPDSDAECSLFDTRGGCNTKSGTCFYIGEILGHYNRLFSNMSDVCGIQSAARGLEPSWPSKPLGRNVEKPPPSRA
jgi:hypothetical protein